MIEGAAVALADRITELVGDSPEQTALLLRATVEELAHRHDRPGVVRDGSARGLSYDYAFELDHHAGRLLASVQGEQTRAAQEAAIFDQRRREAWMEPLARRLWSDRWVWHVAAPGAPGGPPPEIRVAGPVRYSSAGLFAERRWNDGSAGCPHLSLSNWGSDPATGAHHASIPAYAGRFPLMATWGWENEPTEWADVQASYSRDDAAARLEARYRAYVAQAVADLPPSRKREARHIRERREVVTYFAGLLG